jgi:hypothetical protein
MIAIEMSLDFGLHLETGDASTFDLRSRNDYVATEVQLMN